MTVKDLLKYTENQILFGINYHCTNEKGAPIQCSHCGGTKFKDINLDYMESTLCEFSVLCLTCNDIIGHWAYGYWLQ